VLVAVAAASLHAQTRGGAISGRVLLSDGRPADGTRVWAVSVIGNLETLSSLAQTDDQGRYRLEDVPPGDYRIASGPLSLPTYFPRAINAAEGQVIKMTAGQTVTGIDITLAPQSLLQPSPGALRRIPSGPTCIVISESAASYDRNKVVTITGKLVALTFINPNGCWGNGLATVEVIQPDGSRVVWKGETQSRNYFLRQGWTADGFNSLAGQNATMTGYRAKNGSNEMWLRTMTTEKGAVVVEELNGISVKVENGVVMALPK
jgi:hypothetical protein